MRQRRIISKMESQRIRVIRRGLIKTTTTEPPQKKQQQQQKTKKTTTKKQQQKPQNKTKQKNKRE